MNVNIEQMRLALLFAEIEAELVDADHAGQTHGTPYCYTAGCKGPICRYGHAARVRRYHGHVTRMDPNTVNVIEQYIALHRETRVLLDQIEELDRVGEIPAA